MEQSNVSARYTVVYYDALRKLDVTVMEYAVLDVVAKLSRRTGYCYKSAASMGEDMGEDKRSIQYIVQKLIKRKLLVRLNDYALVVSEDFLNATELYQKSGGDTKNSYPLQNSGRGDTKNSEGGYKNLSKKQGPRVIVRNIVRTNNTNVLFGSDEPQTKQKPEINEMFEFWKTQVGYGIESRLKANRFACSNLIKKYGVEKVQQLIKGVVLTQDDPYAPRIADFSALQAKQNDLIAWGQRKQREEPRSIRI